MAMPQFGVLVLADDAAASQSGQVQQQAESRQIVLFMVRASLFRHLDTADDSGV